MEVGRTTNITELAMFAATREPMNVVDVQILAHIQRLCKVCEAKGSNGLLEIACLYGLIGSLLHWQWSGGKIQKG